MRGGHRQPATSSVSAWTTARYSCAPKAWEKTAWRSFEKEPLLWRKNLAQLLVQCTENARKHEIRPNHTLRLHKSRRIRKKTWWSCLCNAEWSAWGPEKAPEAAIAANGKEKGAGPGSPVLQQRAPAERGRFAPRHLLLELSSEKAD